VNRLPNQHRLYILTIAFMFCPPPSLPAPQRAPRWFSFHAWDDAVGRNWNQFLLVSAVLSLLPLFGVVRPGWLLDEEMFQYKLLFLANRFRGDSPELCFYFHRGERCCGNLVHQRFFPFPVHYSSLVPFYSVNNKFIWLSPEPGHVITFS